MPQQKAPKAANPEYFNIIRPQEWDIIDYLDRSLSPRSAATHGLSYLNESGPHPEMRKAYARNMYKWGEALKDISMKYKRSAAHSLLRNREIPHRAKNWFFNISGSGKVHPRKPKASVVVNRTLHKNNVSIATAAGDFYQVLNQHPVSATPESMTPEPPTSPHVSDSGGTVRSPNMSPTMMTPIPISATSFRFSSTGRSLDEVIRSTPLPIEHLAFDGVVDLEDEEVVGLLCPLEREELHMLLPPVPVPDEAFMQSLARFSKASDEDDFRAVVENVPYRDRHVKYDHEQHVDAEWVNIAILSLLRLLASFKDLKALNPREGWLDCNIWANLIDSCAIGHPELLWQRKEVKATAIKWREEKLGIQSDKANANSKLDCVMQTTRGHPHLEFGAVEVSTEFVNTGTAKWLDTNRKLIISLHSMAGYICEIVDHDKDTLKALEFIAFIHAGFNFQIIRLVPISPSQSILGRGKLHTVPTLMDSLCQIFGPMKSIHMAMKILSRSVKAVQNYLRKQDVDTSQPSLFQSNLERSGL